MQRVIASLILANLRAKPSISTLKTLGFLTSSTTELDNGSSGSSGRRGGSIRLVVVASRYIYLSISSGRYFGSGGGSSSGGKEGNLITLSFTSLRQRRCLAFSIRVPSSSFIESLTLSIPLLSTTVAKERFCCLILVVVTLEAIALLTTIVPSI